MNKTRQIFESKQAQVLVCGSGRVMVAINEEKLKVAEQVPVAMTKNGMMKYETREKTKYAYDVYWITIPSSSPHDSAAVLEAAKTSMLAEITAYDASSSVNSFLLNGMEVWLDKAIQLLSALEMYALECFNVTAAHKKSVSELDNIEEVLTYDYKSGYPEKLKMEV